ncbi:MAG: phenylalanine--tRNA ligase subunit beta [Oscillospiraceae bacterium]|nr:phenylalanine--tRNA ligase subunit beta [Oscillospiraceae bacterium]
MNLSMRWLNDYIKPDVPVKRYAADMTMSGSKVELFMTEGQELKNIVAGKVLSIEKHPNADTLYICKVDTGGDKPLQIVTGADNVTQGAFVPVAMNDSVVFGGKEIKAGKLRGELSEGMLCSLSELGLSVNDFPYAREDGIFLLGDDCEKTVGMDIREAIGLNDTVVEFEITSNRPDCLSVIGLARETAATYGEKLEVQPLSVQAGGGDVNEVISVEVKNPQLCTRYAAAAVKDVKIEPSPRWMRERLRAAGVRPINNIVDITNYVMLEYGHPMHAFDLRHVTGAKIVVRNAEDGEAITTLDGVKRKLSPGMLVIADSANPTAVAGVMGGEFSGVYDDTSTVIFESACFNGASVRSTSKKLGLRTESSSRFEKGLDPENCMPALMRACELVEKLEAGIVCDGFADVYGAKKERTRLTLDHAAICGLLGLEIPESDMRRTLKSLGFEVDGKQVTVPSFRADVECGADLAEEIARIYGYDKIPATAIRGLADGQLSREQKFGRMVSQILIAAGYSEIITYSFISPKYYDKIGLPKDSTLRKSLTISNPLGEDTSIMRTTALPSMLEVLAKNYHNRNAAVRFYEIATEYAPQDGEKLPREDKKIMLGCYGAGVDFFALKGCVETLLECAGITGWDIEAVQHDNAFHPGRCARVAIKGEELGVLGEIHPLIAENYDVQAKMYAARIDFRALLAHSNPEKKYKPLPKFPAMTRDLALVCDDDMPVLLIQKEIEASVGGILEKLEMFDVYRGKQIGEGKKSVAYSLKLRALDRTLTDDECDKAVQKALEALEKKDVKLRS